MTNDNFNKPAHTAQKNIADTARLWLIRLRDDDVAVEQIAQWQKWMAASPDHSKAYERAERVWQKTSGINLQSLEPTLAQINGDDYSGEQSVQEYLNAQLSAQAIVKMAEISPDQLVANSRYSLRGGRMFWGAGAAMAASLLVGAFVLSNLSVPSPDPMVPLIVGQKVDTDREITASIVTAKAEHRTAKLFDGSEVSVGADSHVSVDFSQTNRQVNLSTGEAYFDVAPDKDRPFIVTTPLGNVTAVGTAFNVRLTGDRIVVTVIEGVVDVRPDLNLKNELTVSGSNLLNPHAIIDAVRVEAGSVLSMVKQVNIVTPQQVQPAPDLTWREQRLVYRSEPLKYVIADIDRYSKQSIRIQDAAVGELSYSGVVSPKDTKAWLDALSLVFDVEVEYTMDGEIYVRSKAR